MAYQIYYSPEDNFKYPKQNKRTKVKWSRIVLCTAILTVAVVCVSNRNTIKQLLLPGDPVRTEAALTEFVDNIRIGEPFKDAVTTFCLEILDSVKHET